jgi:ring-1,2-phenylacetyl-CoA epoxidase subunit PaaD
MVSAVATASNAIVQAWEVLQQVRDPEIPVLSVCDLGIVRDVRELPDGTLEVVLTPTYSGCPATEVIQHDVAAALGAAGLEARLTLQRSPAWTTDWLTPAAHEKLRAYGIAPPQSGERKGCAVSELLAGLPQSVTCPQCGSGKTERLAQFGSTPCKALYRCLDCREPFDYFKPI